MSNLVEGYPVRRNYAWELIGGQKVYYDVVGADSLPDGWTDPVPLLFRKRIRNQGGPQPNFTRGVEITRAA